MTNRIYNYIIIFFLWVFVLNVSKANEQFIFNITELDIKNKGNLIKGSKGGIAKTGDGVEIIGNTFLYNKITNILEVIGNVKFIDKEKDTIINSDKVTYLKNDEVIFTEGNSESFNQNYKITASNFKFDKKKNILIANDNVKFIDKEKDTIINSDKVTYLKNDEVIFTKGITTAVIEKEYKINSEDIKFLKKENNIYSNKKSFVDDGNRNTYELDNFYYEIDNKILKGNNVHVSSRIDEDKIDNYFFSQGFFNFKEKNFLSKETKIKVHKDIFNNNEQDPRIYGSSSKGDENKTIIYNGIFTSCKITDNCPPWSIQSKKITHDKIKKDMIYENALLKIYDIPVLYFPKFFHPDPTVKRRTGFLQPQFNNSETLGSSMFIPYFKTLGLASDYTFKPTLFNDKYILQNEYRKVTNNSSLITDVSILKGYKSSATNKRKNINHLFANYSKNLNLPNYLKSNLDVKIERVSNDTYLKVFQNNLFETPIMPENKNVMMSNIDLNLEHQNYNLSAEFKVYENLGEKHSDRYQFILPSYNFTKNLNVDNFDGSFNFYSSGSNNLKDTNNLRTSVINDFEYNSADYYTRSGLKNNFNIYFKNLNSLGKNDPTYTSSPRVEGMSIFEIGSSFPLLKKNNNKKEVLTPKISFRTNPGNNMKNNSTTERTLNANNLFEINRLGISDSFENGKSLTLGIDYKLDYESENSSKDKFLEFKLATVIRDKFENNIPTSSTIDQKHSNLFGSIKNNLIENVSLGYDFSIDNDFNTFDSHSLNTEISVNNFITEFNYLEQDSKFGSSHVLSNKTSYNIDNNNLISFSTRRNREIDLTEYYDFSYEYKNDCLTAGIKYNKTFYQDKDLKPTENLFFTITLIPLTKYESSIYDR